MMVESPSILIVDSNKGFAMMLKQSLEQEDHYQAAVAYAGDEALAIASQEPFDLAIVDLGIKVVDDLDGEAVARKLRQEQASLRLMLIPLEGEVLPKELEDMDVQGVLPKPFFLPDLPDLLDAALTKPLKVVEEPAQAPRPGREGPAEAPRPREEEPAQAPRPGREERAEAPEPREEEARRPVAVEPPAARDERSAQIVPELEALAREINADAILLTRGDEVLGSAGRLKTADLNALGQIVSQSCQLSAQAAHVLGREQRHIELSVEGDEHMLYSLTVAEDVLLSAVLHPDVKLGLLRHQAKTTARRLRALMAGG